MKFYDFGDIIASDTEFVIFGIPWDYLSSKDNVNSSTAPQKIREVTKDLALTTEMGVEIPSLKVVDIGDVSIDPTNIERNLREIKDFLIAIYNQKKDVIPVMIGGDHFCTFPVVKTISKEFIADDNIGVLIFDAHLDLYDKWDKGVYSHATVSHRIYDLDQFNKNNLLIVGTRDIDIPEMKIANEKGINHFDAFLFSDLGFKNLSKDIVAFFQNSRIKSLYVSIDIDVLDPSIAPGTGYAIPGGLSYRELWQLLRLLAKNFKIIGCDIVEVSPNLDAPNKMTSNLAAKLLIEFISFISN
ncbi:MAG: agmatinase [Candidatus Lokiarchaeota archaeon]|nr:agmatinase [Candidatus Lokiarchaeota archaeon]